MARLPIVPSDINVWGDVLNEYLLVAHNADGTLKATASSGLYPVTGLVENNSTATVAAANTAAAQAALDAAASAGVFRDPLNFYLSAGGEGANVVLFPPGWYYFDRNVGAGLTDRCLAPGNATIMRGSGMGTRLVMRPGVPTTASPCSVIKPKNNTNWVGIENLTVDGGWEPGDILTDANRASHGIDVSRTGTAELYDGMFWLQNVLIYGCQGSGVMGTGAANTLGCYGVMSYHNAKDGFEFQTDQRAFGCKAGNNDRWGFKVENGTNVLLNSSKAFGNGTSADGGDYAIKYSEDVQITGCESEDFTGLMGLYVQVSRGCRIDMNVYRCQTAAALNAAVWVEDDGTSAADPEGSSRSHHNEIDVTVDMVPISAPFVHPQYLLITRHLGAANAIRIKHRGTTWTTARWNSLGGSTDGTVAFNESGRHGFQTVPYAASITPNPDYGETIFVDDITGALTVNTPVNPVRGQRMAFIFENGAGAGAITLPAAWFVNFTPTTTSGHRNSLTMEYTGAEWVQVAAQTSLT